MLQSNQSKCQNHSYHGICHFASALLECIIRMYDSWILMYALQNYCKSIIEFPYLMLDYMLYLNCLVSNLLQSNQSKCQNYSYRDICHFASALLECMI